MSGRVADCWNAVTESIRWARQAQQEGAVGIMVPAKGGSLVVSTPAPWGPGPLSMQPSAARKAGNGSIHATADGHVSAETPSRWPWKYWMFTQWREG